MMKLIKKNSNFIRSNFFSGEKYPDIPIAACGGYATGQALAAALAMGAGAMVMGSRFIASKESEFHEAIKSIIPP
ncbi:unnamed protein product, partial [marine sediment metagenome]